MSKFKDIKMTLREKALLAIIIAEIEGCQDMQGAIAITNSWVTANGLHPERVTSLSKGKVYLEEVLCPKAFRELKDKLGG